MVQASLPARPLRPIGVHTPGPVASTGTLPVEAGDAAPRLFLGD